MQVYLHKDFIKTKARQMVQQAVKSKKLQRATECEICHLSVQQLQQQKANDIDRFSKKSQKERYPLSGHHFNYFSPYNVWWLCDSCHINLHKAQRYFKCAILDLKKAQELTFNYINWRMQDGYPAYIKKEIKWTKLRLKQIKKEQMKLKDYLTHLKSLNLF